MTVDDKRIYASKLEIDFRDYTKKNTNIIFINGDSFALRFLSKTPRPGESALEEQLLDIEKFMKAKSLQSAHSLFNKSVAFLASVFSIPEAHAKASGSTANGILFEAAILYNNTRMSEGKAFDIRPSHGTQNLSQ